MGELQLQRKKLKRRNVLNVENSFLSRTSLLEKIIKNIEMNVRNG